MPRTTLICTVGGSHRPIVKAIQSTRAEFVCFVCSEDDRVTGNKGSYTQIIGNGLCIKENNKDEKPSLPNIPAQVGLNQDQFEIISVQPDDLTHVCEQIQNWMQHREFANEVVIADYTGGTKTMSAGLVTVALQDERVKLHLITGPRSDLRQVNANHGSATRARAENLRVNQQLKEALLLWQHHGYAEAAQLSQGISNPQDPELNARLEQVRGASQALAEWDCFRHAEAQASLEVYRRKFAASWKDYYNVLGRLNSSDESIRELSQLFDLWRNAQRRASANRFDDAVSRWYRLVEGCAQWILKTQCGILTADVPKAMIPEEWQLSPDKDGKFKVASTNAWKLTAIHGPAKAKEFWSQEQERLQDYLKTRNHSILAHGFRPINQNDWGLLDQWCSNSLVPLMASFAETPPYRMKELPPQLPTEFQI